MIRPIVHLEDAEGVMPTMVGGNENCPQGWHGAELKSPFVRTKGLVGFVSQISSSPGYIDADRRRNRFPVPAPLQPFQFLSRMIQLLVDHGFIAQQLVQFLFQRQEEMIGDRVYFRASIPPTPALSSLCLMTA